MSMHDGTSLCGSMLNSEQELDQMSINELEKLHMNYKISVETKKDELSNQSIIKLRLSDRLKKIYELIESNKEKINELIDHDKKKNNQFTENEDHFTSINDPLLLNDYVDQWNEYKQQINNKFELVDQLMNELGI
jgi:carboxypeptidase C (cathepsin A)